MESPPPPSQPPHAVLLPLPLQGPVNCFLKLAHLLSLSTIHLTFINAAFIHRRLPHLTTRHPTLHFSVVSDGLPSDEPRPAAQFSTMVSAVETQAISLLHHLAAHSPPISCLIADGVFTSVGEAAMRIGIPVVYFSTLGPCCVWANSCLLPALIHAAIVPFKEGDDLDEPVTNINGIEASIRKRDLPGICRTRNMADPYVQLMLKECRELPKAQGLILNSFDDLEGPLLPNLRSVCSNLYNIGPLHLHFRNRLHLEGYQSNSLWQEDHDCITWLNSQPSKSVIFVSSGSVVTLTVEQLMEFWHGLVSSGVRFLWVRRPGMVVGMEDGDESQLQVAEELLEGTKNRGFVVSWAPQEEVLAHRAIGGFLTHSGWNSTLESIVEGVPMLCWPNGIDQLLISRFVGEVWKIGIDMKDTCNRVVIKTLVRDLMETRKEEFTQKGIIVSKLASQAVEKGGTSWCALERLIEDIQFSRLQVPPDTY